ncbi:hypothetical protein [Longimicrobium sp.]|jgi:hypothetical protein|uniref:hypothetical protein n=1 Tax=Longimicrobium sp. TaxID=2029185 RepID=UPI002ED9272A
MIVAGWSQAHVSRELEIPAATLKRWVKAGGWARLRRQAEELQRNAGELVLGMMRAARDSHDPQQAYAAATAARLSGLMRPPALGPTPAEVAEALLDVLIADPELGPALRRRRAEVLTAVSKKIAELHGPAGS